ncbi:aminotransferase class I/II-fold pyridoxal phosphate-dependent enzyme [Fluviispira multicolorata]|uniref:Aminotransferase class I/II-fold pyridoxal phosphate-dependent enzyme n=1 Tax=Fluviispira multicolorata TaxID=2654512 RepID=A0A833JHR3_9BACT|nr:aminotransferase class I/II-fold pyridoxal phosphate-dependent enzyme [Fluviispira multicolorata]KAB8033658.1 aminotransferase class I/II-fold pyridoxal phosphate-dependent enzyme [Fluviispira multicolorata]
MNLPLFKLEDYLSEREFSTDIMFSGSDMEAFLMQDIIKLAKPEILDIWNNLKLSYTYPLGNPILLNELNKKYNLDNYSENICTFSGAEEGIYAALNTILNKDDHVIVFSPCYQSLKEIPNNICEVSEIQLKFLNKKCFFDISEVSTLIKPNTKMIIFNFPHNPSGTIISKEELKYLIDLSRKHGLYIFSDEVYRGLEVNQTDQLPYIASEYEKGISLGVMSKSYGMPGLRVGWLATQDKKLLKKISNMKHYLSICNSAPSEILSIISLQNEDYIYSRNLAILNNNLKLISTFFQEHDSIFEWYSPKGGCIAFPKLKLKRPVYDFCEELRIKEKIVLLPGDIFDHDHNHFRVGFGRLNMPEALSRLKRFITTENLL